MGLIKVDPSQKAPAIALVGVLVVVVGVTVVRLRPPDIAAARATGKPAAQASRQSEAHVATQQASETVAKTPRNNRYSWRSSINPFRRPDWATTPGATGRQPDSVGIDAAPKASPTLPWLPTSTSGISVTPKANTPTLAGGPVPTGAKLPGAAASKPSFTLLATTIGPNRRCAVIQAGDSAARVVAVGDVLEGGYRVKQLSVDRVVLTNGRDTIIGKRTDANTSGNGPAEAEDGI